MLKTILTLDYEIHGNGDGSPRALMIEPTDRLLRLLDGFGAKLTIMADVAEILRFKQYADEMGRDDFQSAQIEQQLRDAVQRGHDVQLHIHSSYFGATCVDGRWVQDWREYDFASLPPHRMDWMIKSGKQFLESLLRPIAPGYKCNVFRAANWSVSPSTNVVNALLKSDIQIDTSVFKYGSRNGRVRFDYSSAVSALMPWKVDADDICAQSPNGHLWEFPIYSELRGIAAFVTPQRLYRALLSRLHRVREDEYDPTAAHKDRDVRRAQRLRAFLGRHAWKADFNQCTGRQLVAALERANARFGGGEQPVPFVLIGHSKLFSRLNEWSLRPFLAHVRHNSDRFGFGKFEEFLPPRPAGDAAQGIDTASVSIAR